MALRKITVKNIAPSIIILTLTISALIMPDNLHAQQNVKFGFSEQASSAKYTARTFAGVEMVLITRNETSQYWISRYEVTQELYSSVTGTNPSYFRGNNLPVEQVSWFNSVEFCNKLSKKAGLKPYYNINKKKDDPENKNSGIKWTVSVNQDADGFRLPTSDEWEFAAKAGSKTGYFWGDDNIDDYCWYSRNSGKSTHPVGMKKPNASGLFDICGNVSEWCFDWHPSFRGLYRIVRDGHYSLSQDELQINKIDYRAPQFEFGFTGIRLVKNR